MDRRSFFGRFSQAIAGAVLAAHIDLGNLVPIPECERMPLPQPLYDIYAVASCKPFATLFEIPDGTEGLPHL